MNCVKGNYKNIDNTALKCSEALLSAQIACHYKINQHRPPSDYYWIKFDLISKYNSLSERFNRVENDRAISKVANIFLTEMRVSYAAQ